MFEVIITIVCSHATGMEREAWGLNGFLPITSVAVSYIIGPTGFVYVLL